MSSADDHSSKDFMMPEHASTDMLFAQPDHQSRHWYSDCNMSADANDSSIVVSTPSHY